MVNQHGLQIEAPRPYMVKFLLVFLLDKHYLILRLRVCFPKIVDEDKDTTSQLDQIIFRKGTYRWKWGLGVQGVRLLKSVGKKRSGLITKANFSSA